MIVLIYLFGFLAISQLLFMGMLNLMFLRHDLTERLVALLCLCLIAVVLALMPEEQFPLPFDYLVTRVAIATPAVLWIMTHYLFEDDNHIPVIAWVILGGYQIVSAIGPYIARYLNVTALSVEIFSFWIMLGVVLHMIYLALRGRDADLLEHRRQLRVVFSAGQGIIVALILVQLLSASILTEEVITDQIFNINLVVTFALIFFFTLAINLNYFRSHVQPGAMVTSVAVEDTASVSAPVKSNSVNPKTLSRIKGLMEEEKLYRNPELTIKELASQVNVGEHKLRKVINEGLGHRNFNQFLSQYRIAEAKQLLLDSEQSPIYLVALEVGYASLSSFNKAFKEITGDTPSNFRKKEGPTGQPGGTLKN